MNGSSCEVEVPRPKFTPKHSFDSSVFPHYNFEIDLMNASLISNSCTPFLFQEMIRREYE
jgi:hypothetical protein